MYGIKSDLVSEDSDLCWSQSQQGIECSLLKKTKCSFSEDITIIFLLYLNVMISPYGLFQILFHKNKTPENILNICVVGREGGHALCFN